MPHRPPGSLTSAAVFSQFTGKIEEQNPEQALGWITAQYEQLVGQCSTN